MVLLLVTCISAAAPSQSPQQLYKDATAAYERGDVTQAISLYQQILKLQPNSVVVLTDLGIAFARVGRYSEAVRQYQEALKQDPENAIVRLNLGLAWYKQADFTRAATELENLRKKHGDNRQSLYLLADCYLRLGENAEVVSLLEPAYAATPEDLAVDYALGTALIRLGRVEQGEVVIDRILKKKESAEATLLLAEAQYASGEYKVAADTLRKALELNANIPEAWSLYGQALLHSEDPAGAKTAFIRALQMDPNDFGANLYVGSLLRGEGNKEEAAAYAERALRLRPSSPEARFQVAAAHAALGQLEEARNEFEKMERDWPDFMEVHVQLAALYVRMNLKQESEREREMVLKLNEKARQENPQPKR